MFGRYTTGPGRARTIAGSLPGVARHEPARRSREVGPPPALRVRRTTTAILAGMSLIDLRSDTVTHPSPEMRRAMAEAEVGDDVLRDDPTINALEERAAELLGKEDALFVTSGTQGNLVAQLAHLQRGMETIAGRETHIVVDEAGGHAALVHTTIRIL